VATSVAAVPTKVSPPVLCKLRREVRNGRANDFMGAA